MAWPRWVEVVTGVNLVKSDTFRCAAKKPHCSRAGRAVSISARWLPNASHSLPCARWKLLSYTLLYGLSCRMSSNPSRAKRSAVANSLAASFPVTLNVAALRRHAGKMEWQASIAPAKSENAPKSTQNRPRMMKLHASSTLPARTKVQGLQSFSGLAEHLRSHKRRRCP